MRAEFNEETNEQSSDAPRGSWPDLSVWSGVEWSGAAPYSVSRGSLPETTRFGEDLVLTTRDTVGMDGLLDCRNGQKMAAVSLVDVYVCTDNEQAAGRSSA